MFDHFPVVAVEVPDLRVARDDIQNGIRHHGVHGKENVRMPRAEEVDRLFVQQPDAVEVLGGRVRRLVVIVIPAPPSVRMQLKPRSTVSAIRISRALKMLLGPVLNSPKFQNEMARRLCFAASAA